MKRLLFILLAFCPLTKAQTPAPVRVVGCPSGATTGNTYASYTCPLADTSISGNKLIVVGNYSVNAGITSITIKTDQNDTFTINHTGVSGDTNQTVIWASVSPTAGSKNFTVTFNGSANAAFTQWGVIEVMNSGALDICGEHTGTGTAMTAGSATTTVANDMLVAIYEPETGVGGTSWTAGSNSNITWNLGQADIGYGSGQTVSQMYEYGVQTVAGAINPAATQAPSTTYGAVWCSLKATSSGSQPTGMYQTSVQHINLKTTGTSFKIPFPAPAISNLGVLHCITAPLSGPITSVSGSVSGTWTHIGSDVPNHNGSGILEDWYCPNCTMSPADVLTLGATSGMNVADCHVRGFTGAATAPLDTSASATTGSCSSGHCTNTGDQAAGTSTTPLVATPSTSSGVFVIHMGVNSQGVTGTSGACFSDMATSPQEAAQNDLDENNGKCHINYSSASAQTVTFTESAAPNGWAASGEFFKAATSATTAGFNKRVKLERLDP